VAVELNKYQSADPGQCGSCHHFDARQPGDGHGLCLFKLPPWVIKKGDDKDGWEVDPRTVQDTESCSLYETKRTIAGQPVLFVQSRHWEAGKPSR
jgi:hypothetical protein